MTAAVLLILIALGLADTAFSGFRASLGRTGLIDHAREDRRGLRRGALLGVVLVSPAVLILTVDVTLAGQTMTAYHDAGADALLVVGPYAVIVVAALSVYGTLRWELKYLASAAILGPFTLARPLVIIVAAITAIAGAHAIGVAITVILAAAAALLVEPVLNRHYA